MIFQSNLPKSAYLAATKGQMEGHLQFGAERFTGFFVGNCFYVTYHSGWEYNRRITNQKNAAMGYVKRTDEGCEVHFRRFRGLLCPMQFFPLLIFFELALIFGTLVRQRWTSGALLLSLGIGLAAVTVTALISTAAECCTEGSEDGRRTLLSFLMNPMDPYENYRNVP